MKTLNNGQYDRIKKLLSILKEMKISGAAREKFVSRLEHAPQKKRLPGVSDIKDTLSRYSTEFLDRMYDAFARPVPAFARVAVLACVCILVYVYGFMPQAPIVHGIKGTVKIFRANRNEWMFARDNERIGRDDIVKTFSDGRADISCSGMYSMRIKKDSEIKVSQLGSRVHPQTIQFEVAKGKVLAYYNGNGHKRRQGFELKTEELIASVVGTDFMLETSPQSHRSWVGVLDGVVGVTSVQVPEGTLREAATVYVQSRYKTEVSEGQIPKKPEMMMEDEWLQLEELYAIGKKPQVALLISTGSTRTRELLSMAPLYISDREPSILPEKLTKIAQTFNEAMREGSLEKHKESLLQFEEILRRYPNPKYDVPFLLFIGAYHEYLGDHENAIKAFQEVVDRYPQSQFASVAECAIALIYEEKLSEKEKARSAFQKIVSEYPQSQEADEAIAGLKRLLQ